MHINLTTNKLSVSFELKCLTVVGSGMVDAQNLVDLRGWRCKLHQRAFCVSSE